ncbi:hypothetical protein Hanom_Chr16g01459921 [Helianthus anomalus]
MRTICYGLTRMIIRTKTSSCGKVQASPSTNMPSVALSSRSKAVAKIISDSGVSCFLINSTINFTIL